MNINVDKLIKDVSDKAGITIEQARTAVTTAFEAVSKEPEGDEDMKKAALAGIAATTAAVNVVVLPHAR